MNLFGLSFLLFKGIMMIKKRPSNIQTLWMMFKMILTISIQIEAVKILIAFDDNITDLKTNK